MKICPNCHSQMANDKNFCTNCGAKLRSSSEQTVNTTKKLINQNEESKVQQNISVQPENANSPQTSSTNIDFENYWHWLVNSWKKPMQFQESEKWYGIITFVLEDLLFVIGLWVGTNSALGGFGQVDGVTAFKMFMFLILMSVGTLGSSYIGNYFVYSSKRESVVDYINKVAHISNLNMILMVLAFLLFLVGSIKGGLFLSVVASIIFLLAAGVQITAKKNPSRDKFYGLLIFVGIQTLIYLMLGSMLMSALGSIGSAFKMMF